MTQGTDVLHMHLPAVRNLACIQNVLGLDLGRSEANQAGISSAVPQLLYVKTSNEANSSVRMQCARVLLPFWL
jgi:hypothetical protein